VPSAPPVGPRPASPPVSDAVSWPWVVLGLFLFAGCLAPAALNQFPMAFGDTQGYLVAARDFRPSYDRAFGYGAFLRSTGGLLSLWLPVIAQAALAAYLVLRLLSLEASGWPARGRRLLAGLLCAGLILGHLPWNASFLMPDVFTGLMVLALLILSEHWARLRAWERILVVALLFGSVTTHLTHAPLMLGLGLLAGMIGFLLPALTQGRAIASARRAAVLSMAAAVFALGTLTAANFVTYREATPSIGSSVFLFARLQADTDAPRILQEPCEAGADFAICRYLNRLEADRPNQDDFLWDWGRTALLPDLGWVPGFHAEARVLNGRLLREGWRDWIGASLARMPAQLDEFRLGDGMDRAGLGLLLQGLAEIGMPDAAAAIGRSLQAQDRLAPLMPRHLADGLAAAGLLGLPVLFGLGLARGRPAVWWPALLFLAAWLGNATLTALGAEVHGRYGARLVWVAPLLAGLLVLRAIHRGRPAAALARVAGAAVTRQMRLPTSSATSSPPRPSGATPTGRPSALPEVSRKPVSTSSGGPEGRPPAKGTKTTL
jgi:hypothetical protein